MYATNPSPTKSDPDIQLYLLTNARYYHPGQYVEGEVHLTVRSERPYHKLIIGLDGEEEVEWEESNEDSTDRYSKKEKTYTCRFVLSSFSQSINPGQYIYPFKMLLPTMLTGSFYYDAHKYLKYTLQAELVNQATPILTQICSSFLNVIELPRGQVCAQSFTNNVDALSSIVGIVCCTGCYDDGMLTLKLATSTNYIKNGDTIDIQYTVDASQCGADINGVSVNLHEIVQMSDGYRSNSKVIQRYQLFGTGARIGSGQQIQQIRKVKIPQIKEHTAIGQYIARYYLLRLCIGYGYLRYGSGAVIHLIANPTNPQLIQNPMPKHPLEWNPYKFPCVNLENLPPYIYNPSQRFYFLNLPKNPHITMELNRGISYPKVYQQAPSVSNYAVFMDESKFTSSKGKERLMKEEGEEDTGNTYLLNSG